MNALVEVRGRHRHADLSLDEQVMALRYVRGLIERCLGHTARDTHRAYWLGAKALGLRYKVACAIYRDATLFGDEAAVAKHPNVIGLGEDAGWTYFALAGCGRLLKIGHSLDPARRISTLEMISGRRLTEIHRRRGFMLQEHAFHLAGRAGWLGGEWFDFGLLQRVAGFEFLRSLHAPTHDAEVAI